MAFDEENMPLRLFRSPEWEAQVAQEEAARAAVNRPVDRKPLTTAEINERARQYRERQQYKR